MHLVQMIPSVKDIVRDSVRDIVMGGFTVYSGLKAVTIPQDHDVKEGDFPINFLLVSEWNVPVERV